MRKRRRAPAEGAYHHGHLRSALLAAARSIVEQEGVAELSLRAVARRAGVSHSAPYHHFADKAAVLAAVAAAGFEELVGEIEAEQRRGLRENSVGKVVAVGTAYVRYAIAHPAIFRLMFRPELTLPAEHPELREAESRAFGTLVAALAECQANGLVPGADPLPAAMSCWSTVHGFAMLWIDQVAAETPLGQLPLDRLAQHVLQTIMVGVSTFQAEPPGARRKPRRTK
jgi:AcrR family transcriptional regulator